MWNAEVRERQFYRLRRLRQKANSGGIIEDQDL
ncbi:hypothetical protein scyTo_0017955, partial [Scyliorhinus torazame]|nr:hypothetical protein [Scyliorhinus torazame]